MAHGQNQSLERKPTKRSSEHYEDALQNSDLLATWEKLIQNEAFASKARIDVEAILKTVHDAIPNANGPLFTFGIGSHSATLVPK